MKVREAIQKTAFTYLCAEKEKLSKVKSVPHSDIKMEQYLQPSVLEINQSKLLFSLRSRMLEVKVNFKNKYSDLKCPICKESNDSQEHVFECEQILKKCNIVVDKHILYFHIFEKDVETQVAALRLFRVYGGPDKYY